MTALRVLVTGPHGKTGAPTVRLLLQRGHKVRALVRRADARSAALQAAGVDVVVGSLENLPDVERAMRGVQRAYFCPPLEPGALRKAVVFAAAAEAARLESIVALTQWLCDPMHPAVHANEKWLAAHVFRRMRGVGVVFVNPGFFADNYMAVLEPVAHFGLFGMPLGAGTNAPPSNEDIGAVVAALLESPDAHLGASCRPTGPRLLAPDDIAATFSRVLGRKVAYKDLPMSMFLKAARTLGIGDYVLSQLYWFLRDYQRDAFGIGAPTSVVADLTGRAPESFESIARRYVAAYPAARPSPRSTLAAVARMLHTVITPTPRVDSIETHLGHPPADNRVLAADSPSWLATHARGRASERQA